MPSSGQSSCIAANLRRIICTCLNSFTRRLSSRGPCARFTFASTGVSAMQKVLILGAGLICRPIVRYLLESGNVEVTQATRTADKARGMIAGHANGKAVALDVTQADARGRLSELVRT